MNNRDVIPHLQKCFTFAVVQNKGKSTELKAILRAIPNHVFGQHENCGSWCHRGFDDDPSSHQICLKNPELHQALTDLFQKYARNSAKFSAAASSQGNESLNGIMAHKVPRNRCYSQSESADYRWASSICTKNDGESYLPHVASKLCASSGKYTETFAKRQDKIRAQRAANSKFPSTKSRRNVLKRSRENLRKNTEQSEGVQYQPNCGIDMELERSDEPNVNNHIEKEIAITPDSCKIVYFDLESSGFGKCADILQIAAKSDGWTFSVYINPSKSVAPSASLVTGLENRKGELFFHGTRVPSIPLKDALQKFLEFLIFSSKPSMLVAHNARFDTMLLLQGIN